ncbi:MAG: hypothetical protein M1290_00840 [Candidatus Thermoplasmatota archaeon]|jgi:hypothetical protein|nr:hypothetical protein [Candidatus Thermoplasmatota archaeon]MCL5788996.1 hypothetical protein [Candidatus Thermoplasmatota archaeon]
MIRQRNDRDLERFGNITGRWREFSVLYRMLSSLASYAMRLMDILNSGSSSLPVMKSPSDFIHEVREKIACGGICSSLNAMVETIENHWGGLFFCDDDDRIPRTDNGLKVTIRHNKTG